MVCSYHFCILAGKLVIMEELLIKRQISYSCIFPSGTDTLQEILKIIPSKSAIAWASYMLTKKKMMSINQTEADFFIPLLFQMNKKLQHIITNYLQSISVNFSSYVFIDEVSYFNRIFIRKS